MARVSVVIPTYARTGELRRALQSVLSQTLVDIEVLVVDDGTPEQTKSVLSEFDDSRVRFLENFRGKGPAGARNTGLMQAKGDYIGLLDSDDVYLSHHLMDTVNSLERYSETHDLVFGRAVYNQDGVEVPYMGPNLLKRVDSIEPKHRDSNHQGLVVFDDFLLDALVEYGCFFNISSVVFSARVLRDGFLFNEKYANPADYEYWVRLSKEYRFLYLDSAQIQYYLSDSSMSLNNTEEKTERNFQENVTLLNEFLSVEYLTDQQKAIVKRNLAETYFARGYEHRLAHDFPRAISRYFSSFRRQPSFNTVVAFVRALSLGIVEKAARLASVVHR